MAQIGDKVEFTGAILKDGEKKLLGTIRRAVRSWSEKREQARHVGPPQIVMKIDGQRYATHNWSIGGFRLVDFHRPLRSGDIIAGQFISGIRKVKDRNFDARVIRVNASGQVGAQFVELSHEAFIALRDAFADVK